MLVTVAQLARALGVTVRAVRLDVAAGLRPLRRGPRGAALFDLDAARAWRAANRRSRPGEGRPRKPTPAAAPAGGSGPLAGPRVGASRMASAAAGRLDAIESGRRGRAGPGDRPAGPPPVAGVDVADLTPAQLLGMVRSGELLPGQVSTYRAAVDAMKKGLEYRHHAGLLVESAAVALALGEALAVARAMIDQVPEAVVAAVAAVVPLDDSQRRAVRMAARSQCDQLVDQLAAVGGATP